MRKRVLIILLLITTFSVMFAADDHMNLFPIKKRLLGKSVQYEVAFIDYNGKLVIPFEYSWGSVFENGIGVVQKNKQFFLIDSNNNLVKQFDPKYYLFNGFSEGFCIIKDIEKDLYGFINHNGVIEIPIEYTYAYDFSNGIAKVDKGKDSFYINKRNEKVQPEKEDLQTEYKIFVDEETKLLGLKDLNDKIIIPADYNSLCLPTSYGLCVFSKNVDNLSYGVININNEIIYPEGTFYEVHEFKNGMAIFSPRNNSGGYLREDGIVFYFKDYYK